MNRNTRLVRIFIIFLIVSGCSNDRSSISSNQAIQEESNNEPQISPETAKPEEDPRAPVDPARNDLIANMRNESIKETMLNLANFDDDMLAHSTITVVEAAIRKNLLVTRLMRVRKLYVIGQENPELIIPDLRSLLRDSLKKWPEAHKKLLKIMRIM